MGIHRGGQIIAGLPVAALPGISRSLVHNSILLSNGVFGKPGAVHYENRKTIIEYN